MSNFRDTDEYEKQWNCRSTGSKKEKNLKELKATDKSYIVGYYQGSRLVKNEKNPNQPHVLHKILATEIGDKAHSPELTNKEGEIREFFGTTVINKKLAEKTHTGQLVKIQWMGKVEPKEGSEPYHDWKLFVDETASPKLAGAVSNKSNDSSVESKKEEVATTSSTDDDDDLPF